MSLILRSHLHLEDTRSDPDEGAHLGRWFAEVRGATVNGRGHTVTMRRFGDTPAEAERNLKDALREQGFTLESLSEYDGRQRARVF